MKEYPIIFSTDMVKAILDGRKTQTKRIIKFQPEPNHIEEFKETWTKLCRYGQVGDRLWVRETWAAKIIYDHLKPFEIPNTAKIYYIDKHIRKTGGYSLFTEIGKTRSAMFMCGWMSRITLEITEVRVERVQDISYPDILAEGVKDTLVFETTANFIKLWDSLNAKRGYEWDKNPWVWVISFKVIK